MTDLADLQARAARVGALYRQRFGVADDPAFAVCKIAEEAGEVMGAHLRLHGLSRGGEADRATLRRALEDEMADLLGFLLLHAEAEGIDLERAFARKWGQHLEQSDGA